MKRVDSNFYTGDDVLRELDLRPLLDIARIRHRGGLRHSRISIYTYEGGRSSSVSHLPSISKNGAFQPARTFVGFLTYRTAYNTYTLQKKTTTSEGVISFVQVIIHGWGIETWHRKSFSGIRNLPPSIIAHSEFFPCGSLRSSFPAYADQ